MKEQEKQTLVINVNLTRGLVTLLTLALLAIGCDSAPDDTSDGGTPARLHQARTVCRRAERAVVSLAR